MTQNEAHEAMLAHHAHLENEVEDRVQTVRRAVDEAATPGGSGFEPAVAELVAFLGEEVLPHAKAEEHTIYPAAAARADLARTVDEMVGEHRQLVSLVDELAGAGTGLEAASRSVEVAALFRTHVTKENELLLPPLLADTTCDLAGLLEQMRQFTEAPPEGPPVGERDSQIWLEDAFVSILLDASAELSRAGKTNRACRLAAAAWRALRGPRPDPAVRTTGTLHGLARTLIVEPVTWRA